MSVPPSVLVDKIAGYAPSCIGNCGCDCRQIGYSSRSRRRLVYIVLLYRYRSYWELCSALFPTFWVFEWLRHECRWRFFGYLGCLYNVEQFLRRNKTLPSVATYPNVVL